MRIGVVQGICKGCAARLRRDIQTPPPGWRPAHASLPTDPLPVPPLALVLIALAAVLFAERPLDHPAHLARAWFLVDPPPPAVAPDTQPAAGKRSRPDRLTPAGPGVSIVPPSDIEPLWVPGVMTPRGTTAMHRLSEAAPSSVMPAEPPAALVRESAGEGSQLEPTARGDRPAATDEARTALALSSVQAP